MTNDTLHALRAYLRPPERARRPGRVTPFRSRRLVPPSAEGRWTAIAGRSGAAPLTPWATAFAQQLLTRHGVVTREVTAIEQIPGGFTTIYTVLRRLEETGRVRRGLFRGRTRRGAIRATGRGRSAARGARGSARHRLRSRSRPPIRPIRTGRCCRGPSGRSRRQPTRSTAAARNRARHDRQARA